MVFTQRPLSLRESLGHERQNASVTFFSDGDGGTPSISVQAANLWYDNRDTYIVHFVVDGCRKNLPLCDLRVYNTGMNTPDLSDLPVTEKLRIVTQLWNDIASSTDPITVPPEVIREASRRSAELEADPSIAIDDDKLWRRVDG